MHKFFRLSWLILVESLRLLARALSHPAQPALPPPAAPAPSRDPIDIEAESDALPVTWVTPSTFLVAKSGLDPVEVEAIAVAETAAVAMTPPPEPAPPLTRKELVEALLDEAWSQGSRTYEQLICYVREQSGTGCSKQSIRDWKKARGLLETRAAA